MHATQLGTSLAGVEPIDSMVIVGAGFSGTALAIRLARAARTALDITLVEPREELGGGVAYATRDYPYPLNVAAGQMSLDSAAPDDFLEFARDQGIHATAGDYLPRQVYGDYLRARLAAARAAAPHVTITHRRARALRLRHLPDEHLPDAHGPNPTWELWLDDGAALRAHDVVLATGNPSPACLPGLERLCGSPVYAQDPWSLGRPGGRDLENVLLVGSGLTMIDAALRLAAVRPRVRHIHVLSRHGLLPHPQATHASVKKPDLAPLDAAAGSTRRITRAFRTLMRDTVAAGGDWREVLALARARLPALWIGLSSRERARFLRHVRSYWDVHRHRVPAGPLAAVRNLERIGVLEVHAGRLICARAVDDDVEVTWLPRGETRTRAWLVDRIVNCTGPDARADRSADPFIASLIAAGFVRADALSLGLEIATDGRPVGRDGAAVDRLWYLGPWLRARDWEATAVPELRDHAARLAQRILARTGVAARAP
jgi:uncharacterized NAD(P)/FAD-binding protein YdhS